MCPCYHLAVASAPVRRWLGYLGTAFCLFIALGNVASLVVALFTQRWKTIPASLVFAVVFGLIAFSRLRPAKSPDPARSDPGWLASFRGYTPFSFLVLFGRREPMGGLAGLRALFTSFAVAIVLFGVVLTTIPGLPNGPVVPWFPILAVIAMLMLVGERSLERPLLCDSPGALLGSYRTRFFLRIAFAESVALFGFTMTFAGGPAWIYYPAAAFTLIRFATHVAPTRAVFARDQAELDAQGCGLSLVDTLTQPPSA
jgi:hypothetical protein